MKKEYKIKNIKIKFKIFKISIYTFIYLSLIASVFINKEVFSLLFKNSNFKGLSLSQSLLFLLTTLGIFFALLVLLQGSISKLLQKSCDPQLYLQVYNSINNGKNHALGRKIADINATFLMGDFENAKIKCFNFVQTEPNISLRKIAYLILIHIFATTEDLQNLISLKRVVSEIVPDAKSVGIYNSIIHNCDIFINHLNGNHEQLLGIAESISLNNKHRCDYYISKYYQAIVLLKTNKQEEAIKIFEYIIINANKLFVVKFSKINLLKIAL